MAIIFAFGGVGTRQSVAVQTHNMAGLGQLTLTAYIVEFMLIIDSIAVMSGLVTGFQQPKVVPTGEQFVV